MDENVKAKSFIYIQFCRDCTFKCDENLNNYFQLCKIWAG